MRRRPAAAVAAAAVVIASCGGPSQANAVTVLAAASLTEAFTDLAAAFEDTRRDTEVIVSFAGSSTLAAQILAGAPADVFAAADERTMQRLVAAGVVSDPVPFATNRLAIVVPAGEGENITGPADLTRPGMAVALCAPEVPCGALADAMFAAAGLPPPAASREVDVRAVLARVDLGEVDAGVVYETDAVLAADRVDTITIPPGVNVTTSYPIARIGTGTPRPSVEEFVEFVTSAAGLAILAGYGFGAP